MAAATKVAYDAKIAMRHLTLQKGDRLMPSHFASQFPPRRQPPLRLHLPATGLLLCVAAWGTIASAERLAWGAEPGPKPSGAAYGERVTWAAPEAVQAVAADARFFYVVDSTRIAKYDRATGQRLGTSVGDALHLNSAFLYDEKLWCAHSNYPAVPERSEVKTLDLRTLRLETTHDFGDFGGSLTWVVRVGDKWWCNFAHYGDQNGKTFLARFDDQWREEQRWTYPASVLERLGNYSVSGGVADGDAFLVTGHDRRELYRVRAPRDGATLEHLDTLPCPFTGQGIATDSQVVGGLVGIDRAARKVIAARPLSNAVAEPTRSRPPNIVFLLADDLGIGDLGCYGQRKIRTPHLDRLAAEGLRFTQHYSGNAVCAPSRCVLMTGRHPGHSIVRDNREFKPEGQFPLPESTLTIASLLQQAGYATGAFGKWGLGGPDSTGAPHRQGVDRFFGYNCQRVAHNFYPTYLWDNRQRHPLDNPPFSPQQKLPDSADPRDPASYSSYSGREYAPDLITNAALQFIRDHRDRPFFLYYPTTVPHLALQVPDDSVEEYRDKFDDEPYRGDRSYLPHRTPRAAYAAMVTRLDREIGRIVQLLQELSLDRDTLIIFSSDNGPLYDRLGGTDTDYFQSALDLRGRKGSLYEGGVRAPLIVRWPGRVAPGTTTDFVSGFEDWLPTLAEIVPPRDPLPADLDGISLLPTLQGKPQAERRLLYREFPSYGGQQSIRVGDWKAIRQNLAPAAAKKAGERAGRLELYNLATDRSESRDVATEHPDVVERLGRLMRQQHTPSTGFPFAALDRESAEP